MAFNFPASWGPFPGAQFPYTQTGGLNMDWVLQAVKTLAATIEQFVSLNTIKYADPLQWDITRQYATNTLVIDPQDGTAYLSVQPVPPGVQITNTEYWTPVFTLENFTDFLKSAIASGQEEAGQPATETIPAGSVFWVGNQLVYTANEIPAGTVVIPGSNCTPVTVEDLINEVYNTAYAVYSPADTTIKLGWVRSNLPPDSTAVCDTHTYNQQSETIKITAKRC